MKKINLEKFSTEIKKYNIKSFLDAAPQKIKNNFKMLKILCYILNNNLDPNNLSNVELAKEYKISNSTISRLFLKKFEIHKKLWNFVLTTEVCKLHNEEEKFAYFMINFVIPNLSLHTIKKNRIFNYFHKIGVNLGLFEYKSIHNNKNDAKEIKKEQFKILSKTEKSIRKRRIKIIADTDSSETIKKLAKDFGCEIKNKTNIISKYEKLAY